MLAEAHMVPEADWLPVLVAEPAPVGLAIAEVVWLSALESSSTSSTSRLHWGAMGALGCCGGSSLCRFWRQRIKSVTF